jgi:anti-sigma28 factor (negative regulator of flagellin synthesis)
MQIHGPHQIHGAHGIQSPHAPHSAQGAGQAPAAAQVPADLFEISPAAQAAIQAAETGEVRQELVDRIRAEIADGTYETVEKLDVTIERLLDEIA